MPLQKQPISINFSKGLDLKSDPYQVQIGNFLALQNSVFNAAGRLTKRNGFANITTLPNADQTTLTTLNDNLIATGSNLYSFNSEIDSWLNKGLVQPVQLATQPLVRVSTSQSSPDVAITDSGLACLVYEDNGLAYYQVSDSNTGEQVVSRVSLGAATSDARVFILGRYFAITYIQVIGGNRHLRLVAIPIALPASPIAATDVATGLRAVTTGYDGIVANDILFLGWATSTNTLNVTSVSQSLVIASPTVVLTHTATLMSLAADVSTSLATIWMTFWDSVSNNGYTSSFSQNLAPILAPTQIITTTVINEITSSTLNTSLKVMYENANTYGSGPNSAVKTDYLSTLSVSYIGTVTAPSIILRSVGLASKTFVSDAGVIYAIGTFGEGNQNTYFLIDFSGNIYMRLAYSNGGGYEASQVLPTVSIVDNEYFVPYLVTDFLATVNKGTNNPAGTPANAIYTQTGVNLATFTINSTGQYSSEIAGALHLTGGQLWEYDSVKPVEFGFQVWPENVSATTSGAGGLMTAQTYFYQVTYEWTDNQGNLHRSAPSIPLPIVTSGATSSVTLYIPTLRLTYKRSPNPVRIVIYRWSQAQQVYYQVTSITSPLLNNPAIDLVTYTDTLADSAILGNVILYTTGGVIENIAPPASIHSALFNNRLWLIDAEDRNLLWYSKQVIEATPVEMSDLLTIYVAPTSGAQGSTGPVTALSAMDDKLIVFKSDAIYYINGIGPDNTGANSGYSDPVFITAAVGCANPNSIVLMPNGLMFQSDKGIWMLDRNLSTVYIGAPVEQYNSNVVRSAQSIPGTNQVRFILDNDITLMYDYFYAQWGTFSNTFAISATLYQGFHTYLNQFGAVFQETPGTYLDGSKPVLMSLTTSWIAFGGFSSSGQAVSAIQGYERFYEMFLLGTYYTPFKLNVSIAYNYLSSNLQQTTVVPDNFASAWGGEAVWGGGGAWGGPGNVFEARVFPQQQKCESFQVTLEEIYDPSLGANTGQGLTLSGLSLIVGVKRGFRTQKAGQSFG